MRQSSAAAFTSAVSLVCERGGGGGRREVREGGREKGKNRGGWEVKREGVRGRERTELRMEGGIAIGTV